MWELLKLAKNPTKFSDKWGGASASLRGSPGAGVSTFLPTCSMAFSPNLGKSVLGDPTRHARVQIISIAAGLCFIANITSHWSEMTGSSPGFQDFGGPGSSSGQHRLPVEEGGNDDVSEHQNLDNTLLDDDPLGDLSQAQLVFPNCTCSQ